MPASGSSAPPGVRERSLVIRMLNERSMHLRRAQLAQATTAMDEDEPCPTHPHFPLDLTEPDSEEGGLSSDTDMPPMPAPTGLGLDCSSLQGPPPCSWLSQGQHWSKFPGFVPTLRTQAGLHNGKCPALSTSGSVFLRLKEQFFVNARADCGLTIAGFYYVSVCRQTGCITGYYWDPQSTPFQLLHLTPATGSSGASFGSYEFH
ncbi:vacuolar import and degradation protein-domain-containing protein [Dunaliella salina]|uniref:Vacuolar import and degradation protein-domain-containing protein n=1 Tax=Dunaliella salina TaxID=3046 RepID=A0ABQ7H1H6_DUNSA|nr:vacuolar import and degradation protein-domain-containing protein [Dunaliella salina]|eukprot:KAF5840718.1 vacuolar import and degradation protein-domain-containing protein [Dunaliella salina]